MVFAFIIIFIRSYFNFTPGLKDINSNKTKRKKPSQTKKNRKRKIDQYLSDDSDEDDDDNSMDVDNNSQEVEFIQSDAEMPFPYSLQSLLVALLQVINYCTLRSLFLLIDIYI